MAKINLNDREDHSILSNGGRGIRNQLEYHFINPLARGLFDCDANAGVQWKITAIQRPANQTQLTLEQ